MFLLLPRNHREFRPHGGIHHCHTVHTAMLPDSVGRPRRVGKHHIIPEHIPPRWYPVCRGDSQVSSAKYRVPIEESGCRRIEPFAERLVPTKDRKSTRLNSSHLGIS